MAVILLCCARRLVHPPTVRQLWYWDFAEEVLKLTVSH